MSNTREYRLKKKQEVVTRYGGHCVCCGETKVEFLTMDHIDGRGADHRRELSPNKATRPSGGLSFYLRLLKLDYRDPNMQVLCWNCNCTKHQYGVCPHEQTLTDLIASGIVYLEDRNTTPGGVMVATQS